MNRRALTRAVRWGVIAVVIAALVIWALRPSPVPVDLVTAERGTLIVTLDEEGETRVRNRYVVSAPVPGHMHRIELDPGDRVKAGTTVLAMFQPSDPALLDARTRAELQARARAAEAAVGRARAERERVAAELEFARRELKRQEFLAEEGVIARTQLEATQREVRSLEEALQAAEFQARTAQYELEMARASLVQRPASGGPLMRLTSPIDGVVLRLLQESETVVPTGQPLIEVGDVSDLEIVADFLSTDAVRIQPGDEVLVEQWGGAHAIAGRVRLVEPSGFTKISALGVEEQRVNVIVDFTGPPSEWQRLGDGYRVEVRVVVDRRDDVVKVPTSTLFRQNDGWAVYVVESGVARRRVVDVGAQNGLEAEIRSGLTQGDVVVAFPSDDVQDGVQVAPRGDV